MSFQSHESNSPANPAIKVTGEWQPWSVVKLPHFDRKMATNFLCKNMHKPFICYNIRS